MHPYWRCISYWTWGIFQPAMLVYWRVLLISVFCSRFVFFFVLEMSMESLGFLGDRQLDVFFCFFFFRSMLLFFGCWGIPESPTSWEKKTMWIFGQTKPLFRILGTFLGSKNSVSGWAMHLFPPTCSPETFRFMELSINSKIILKTPKINTSLGVLDKVGDRLEGRELGIYSPRSFSHFAPEKLPGPNRKVVCQLPTTILNRSKLAVKLRICNSYKLRDHHLGGPFLGSFSHSLPSPGFFTLIFSWSRCKRAILRLVA